MQGPTVVLDALNALLADELAARDPYFIHSRMLAHSGFAKAAERIAHEMGDETAHADALIKRILMSWPDRSMRRPMPLVGTALALPGPCTCGEPRKVLLTIAHRFRRAA